MGKIIKNGIEYGGSTNEAVNINYDNSASGLSASSVQTAIYELMGRIYYRVGDTYSNTSTNRGSYVGYISSSNTTVTVTLILDKQMSSDISTITVNSLNGLMRGDLGYIDGITSSANLLANYTVSADKIAPNLIRLLIVKDSAMTNSTNNTPVILMARFSLTFS